MPVTQIFSLPGRSAEEKQLIMECIHEALMTRFDIPHDDQYMIFNEKEREDFFSAPSRRWSAAMPFS
ncbi:tautomerase family protein [Pannonibacter sp. Pt2-lr]